MTMIELDFPHDIQQGKRADIDRRERVARLLSGLTECGCKHVLLHGHGDFEGLNNNDIDILIDPGVPEAAVVRAVKTGAEIAGLSLVRQQGEFFTLCSHESQEEPIFFSLDILRDGSFDGYRYVENTEILKDRVVDDEIFVPCPAHEFASSAIRAMLKGEFSKGRKSRLMHLMCKAPEECSGHIKKSGLPEEIAKDIIAAARSGDWSSFCPIGEDRVTQTRQVFSDRQLQSRASRALRDWRNRLQRLARPKGLVVVLLGQDGAGKSTAIDWLELPGRLPFEQVKVLGFAPALHRVVKKGPVSTATPHALPARSLPVSLIKAAYWFMHSALAVPLLRMAKARNHLVLYDRHFVDVMVDPVRYRYGGPTFLLDLIWRVTPKPDLILLLDAPPEVLHARKPELELDERHRQRTAYMQLVAGLQNTRIIDATRPQSSVLSALRECIVEALIKREAQKV